MRSLCTNIFRVLLLCLPANQISGAIYKLTDSEYEQMPPIRYLDEYDDCFKDHHGVYCSVQFTAVSDEASELLIMMKEYSEETKLHYNHTNFNHGVCVTKKCGHYLDQNTGVSKEILEACLNESFWKEYKLKTEVYRYTCNQINDGRIPIDTSDVIVGLIILSLVLLNIFGSLNDVLFENNNWKGNKYLLSFSITFNWRKLFSIHGSSDHPVSLRAIYGIKSVILLAVMRGHCNWSYLHTAENVLDIEKSYDYISPYIFLNGSIIIQISFFVSGFLLMYNILQYSETNVVSIRLLLKGLLNRWLRITPCYAVVLGIMATWYRRMGSGPFWENISMQSANDCRRNWWAHMLFLNNFVYNSQCLGHTWFIAADTQLYVVGLLVCLLVTAPSSRRNTLILLYGIGIMIPAIIVYFLDLDARFIHSPEATRAFFDEDRTYNELYIRSYTNIAPFALGLIMADRVYRWQRNKVSLDSIKKYKKYRFAYWSLLPVSFVLHLSGMYFYRDAPRDPVLMRVLFATSVPNLYILTCALLFLGIIFKFENIYRTFFEWNGWKIPGRLSYAAYLIQFPVIRFITGSKRSLTNFTDLDMMATYIGMATMTFSLAALLWLLVEAPFTQIAQIYLKPKRKQI